MKFIQLTPFIMLLLIFGCKSGGSSCEGVGSHSTKFDITDLGIKILIAPEEKSSPQMAFEEIITEETQETKVNYNDIIFSINSEIQTIAAKIKQDSSFSFSLISSAYACSPVAPSTSEKIVDIKITSSSAFDSLLSAGDSLNTKFNVVYADSETKFYNYKSSTSEYYSLTKYLEQDDVYAGKVLQLKLIESPEFIENHVFYIEVRLDTGETFFLESPELSFAN